MVIVVRGETSKLAVEETSFPRKTRLKHGVEFSSLPPHLLPGRKAVCLRTGAIQLCILLTIAAVPACAQCPKQPSITQAELVRRTQQLYDALVVGDQEPWKTYYADDAVLYDEKGRAMDKKALVADVQVLPSGYSASIKIVNPRTFASAGAVSLAYDSDETETIFGQVLHARYHTVDTWLYRGGTWQISVTQAMRYYESPALGVTDKAHLNDFVGTYRLSAESIRTVSRTGDALFLQRGAGPRTKLLPESGDLFYRTGIEGRILFHRGPDGKVDALYDRRNNEDVVWTRVP